MESTEPMTILIVDDEEPIRRALSNFLGKIGHKTASARSAAEARAAIQSSDPDMVLLDIRLPDQDGLSLFQDLRQSKPDLCIIMISGHGTLDTAIEAMRLGAADFLKKPVELLELEAAIERSSRLLRFQREDRRLRSTIETIQRGSTAADDPFASIVGESEATAALRQSLALAAQNACRSLLITGPTGTGKEVAARAFHDLGAGGPFIAVNCPALPGNLVESELFGHVKGAFTGATGERIGAFELADGGTLFLDEITDLSLDAQAKLLRVLESRTVRRVGAQRERHVDIAIVAASNRSLLDCVTAKQFREDLYYRLNVFDIQLLPLCDRPADILPLARHFAHLYCTSVGRPPCRISAAAAAALITYEFPGNARELRNIIERAIMISTNNCIELGDLSLGTGRVSAAPATPPAPDNPASQASATLSATALDAEREAMATLDALETSRWNRRAAAETLGITYEALRWRIKKHGLKRT